MAGGPEDEAGDGQHQRHQEHRPQLHRGQQPHGGGPRGHVVHLHHGVKQLEGYNIINLDMTDCDFYRVSAKKFGHRAQ